LISGKLIAESSKLQFRYSVGQPTVAAFRGRHGGRPYYELSALSYELLFFMLVRIGAVGVGVDMLVHVKFVV
jgi:hypothetical protein